MGRLLQHATMKRDEQEEEDSRINRPEQTDEECWELHELPVLDYETTAVERGETVDGQDDVTSTCSIGPTTPGDELGPELFGDLAKKDELPSFYPEPLEIDRRARGSKERDDLAAEGGSRTIWSGVYIVDACDNPHCPGNKGMTAGRAGRATAQARRLQIDWTEQRHESGIKASDQDISSPSELLCPHGSTTCEDCCDPVKYAKQDDEWYEDHPRATRPSSLRGSEYPMSSPLPDPRLTLFSDSIPSLTYLKARVQRVFRRRFCRRNSGDLGGIALDDAEKGHRVRGCARASSVRRLTWIFAGIMFGTVVCLVLAFYAWNVEVLWGGEMAPGRYHGGVWLGGLQNHTALPVKRRWLHSHNDEMHGADALLLALRLGYGSVEVDTWLGPSPSHLSAVSSAVASKGRKRDLPGASRLVDSRGTAGAVGSVPDDTFMMLTGHKAKDISGRTLAESYLDPLFARLEENNRGRLVNETVVGLYKDDPTAEVQFVIDMKSDGDATWPYLVAALQRFMDRGYLSTYDTSTSQWSRSAIMVIGTGNTPVHRVYHQNPRVIFYDAPLKRLSQSVSIPHSDAGPATRFEWDSTIAPMASDKFPIAYHLALAMPPWNNYIVTRLRGYTMEAARRGIDARWWGSARNPGWVRRRLWEVQKQGGVVWTNADDLVDAVDWLTEYEAR